MKYQRNNDAIYQMRQEILKDIREYAARTTQRTEGTFIIGILSPIVTFEEDDAVSNASVTGFVFDKSTVIEFALEDVFDHSIHKSIGGDNIYLEGLNDILDVVESQALYKISDAHE